MFVVNELSKIKSNLKITLINFGYKGTKGEWPHADHYIDCRTIANPAHAGGETCGSGDSPIVQAWVRKNTLISIYVSQVVEGLTHLSTRRGDGEEYHKDYVVAPFCAHGIHRSRAMKYILGEELTKLGYQVVVK